MLKDKLITNIETASKSESVKLIRDYISIVESKLNPVVAHKRLKKIKQALGDYIVFDVLFKMAIGTCIVHTVGMMILGRDADVNYLLILPVVFTRLCFWYAKERLFRKLRVLNNSINTCYIFKDYKYKFY